MSTKPYDGAFKFLAEQDAESLLLMLGFLHPGDQPEIELLPRELNISAQLPDQPYKVRVGNVVRIAHVEAQTVYEIEVPDRMVEYGVRTWLKYRLPVEGYVLLLTDKGLPEQVTEQGRIDAGGLSVTLNYRLIKIWEIPAREMIDLDRVNLLPFVPLMSCTRQDLEQAADQLADVHQQQELRLHFIMLGGLRYNREYLIDWTLDKINVNTCIY